MVSGWALYRDMAHVRSLPAFPRIPDLIGFVPPASPEVSSVIEGRHCCHTPTLPSTDYTEHIVTSQGVTRDQMEDPRVPIASR